MRASDVRSRYDPYGLAKVYQAPLVAQQRRNLSKQWDYHLQVAIA
eukprot:COSAG01_NODE_72241_length_253_cov_1.149351_1_plen_44_part_10